MFRFTALTGRIAAIGVALAFPLLAGAQQKITVAWYGGNWGDAFKACVADPFTKATGIEVVPEIGTSTTTLSKLEQQKSAPTIDAAWMDGGISELANSAGVLDNLDPAAIPNMKQLTPRAVYRAGSMTYAVGTGYYSLGLTYNTKQVKQPPTSWRDLWKPEFAGASAIPSPSNSAGVPFVLFLAKVWGVDPKHLDPVYEKIAALDAALLYDSSGAATNAFQRGEAVIGAHFNVGAWDLIDKGMPIGFVVPKEGVWATDARLHLVKGSRNKRAAESFINQALTAESASCLASRLYLGPAVMNVKVAPDVAKKLPWGVNGSVDNLNLFDWHEVNERRAEIVDAWNRRVASKH
jgi:putative spermidine/putrescine transport system substrate-binding protein